jgi:hypothetical protein
MQDNWQTLANQEPRDFEVCLVRFREDGGEWVATWDARRHCWVYASGSTTRAYGHDAWISAPEEG